MQGTINNPEYHCSAPSLRRHRTAKAYVEAYAAAQEIIKVLHRIEADEAENACHDAAKEDTGQQIKKFSWPLRA